MHLAIRSPDVAVPNNSYLPNDFRSIDLTIWLLRGTWPGDWVAQEHWSVGSLPIVSGKALGFVLNFEELGQPQVKQVFL